MKKIVTLFFCFSVFFQLFASNGKEKLRLAIIDIEDKSGNFDLDTLSKATEYMLNQFISSNKYTIIPKDRQENAIIKIMKENSYKSCYAENCQIQLGQELSADTVLSTAITYFGGVYTLRAAFMNLEKAVIEQGVSSDFIENDEESLRDAIDDIVAQITGGKKQKSRKKPKKTMEESPEICKQARNRAKEYENDNNYDLAINIWSEYIKNYPDGLCYSEAKIEVKFLKDRKPDWKLRNSDFYGVYDNLEERERWGRMYWPMIIGVLPVTAGAMVMGLGSLGDDKKSCIIAGSVLLGVSVPLYITGITYAVWDNYTKGERAAGFMISFGALAVAGGGVMAGMSGGDQSLLGGGIAAAAVGGGLLIGGITMAILDAKARKLKGTQPKTSFFVSPTKGGVYAQLGVNF